MAVLQVAFEVPSEIKKGVHEGSLMIFGGVVRNNAGQIVQHLKEVKILEDKDDSNKALKVIGLAVLAVSIIGLVIYNIWKKRDKTQKVINQFNQDFATYILAAQKEELNSEILGNLHHSIELVRGLYRKPKKQKKLKSAIDMNNLDLLVDLLYGYTLELAAKNGIADRGIKRSKKTEIVNNIIDLQKYIEIQQKIFKKSA